jgi:hypothetical protein
MSRGKGMLTSAIWAQSVRLGLPPARPEGKHSENTWASVGLVLASNTQEAKLTSQW